jgi:hypothetical protein
MARIKLGSLVNSISGSIGQTVFSIWKGLAYTRRKAPTVDNPQTEAQNAPRAALSELAKAYHKHLSPEEKANWETLSEMLGSASTDEGTSVGGQGLITPRGTTMSGYNAFVSYNLERASIGYDVTEEFIKDAPKGLPGPSDPQDLDAQYDPVTGAVQGHVTTPAELGPTRERTNEFGETIQEPPKLRLWVKPKDLHPRIQEIFDLPGPNEVIPFCVETIAEYGEQRPLIPGGFDLQCDVTTAFGQTSSPSNQKRVQIPACCTPVTPGEEAIEFLSINGDVEVTFPVIEADGDCRADYVEIKIKKGTDEPVRFTVPRAAWTEKSPTEYVATVYFPGATGDSGVFRYGTTCGKTGMWTAALTIGS